MTLPDKDTRKQSTGYSPTMIDRLIDGELGFDVLWARGLKCPCRMNPQTEQPDQTCGYCEGTGFMYVHPDPDNYPEQLAFTDGRVELYAGGLPIRAIITNMTWDAQIFEKFGEWVAGMANVSVRGDIRLHYADRLIMRDALMSFNQVLQQSTLAATIAVGPDPTTMLRYPAVEVLEIRTHTTRWRNRQHFTVNNAGQIVWEALQGPAADAYFSVHYLYHPRWIVVDFPNMLRGARVSPKFIEETKHTYKDFPVKATVKLDFLVGRG